MDLKLALADEADLPWSWDHLLRAQLQGQDPTSWWRDQVAASARQTYGQVVAPTLPAAFVLQWSLEVVAEAGLYAAQQLRGIHDPALSGLTFAVHPVQGYPTRARFKTVLSAMSTGDSSQDLVAANHAVYRDCAVGFAESYRAGVNLGRQQRVEMVRDVWAATVARGEGNPPPARGSCCYIYVLPGARECAGCPRRGPGR